MRSLLCVVVLVACCGSGGFGSAEDFTVPERAPFSTGLAVRPDTIVIPFAVRGPALSSIHTLVDELAAVAAKACPATLRLRGVTTADGPVLVVDGELLLPMAPTADFWARAGCLVAVERVAAQLTRRQQKLAVTLAVNEARFVVLDPERHRAQLVAEWIARARALAAAAETQLRVVDCHPSEPVVQEEVSAEEVRLTLPIDCRLDR